MLKRQAGARSLADETLKAVYFDTPQQELHGEGVTLQVRTENGKIVQSVKRSERGATAAPSSVTSGKTRSKGKSPISRSGRADAPYVACSVEVRFWSRSSR